MAAPHRRTGRPQHSDVLTPAEWDVLAGVRDGLSNREIAEERGCSVETVRFHLRNLRVKLRVSGRDGLRAFPGRPAPEIDRARRSRAGRRIREQIPLIATPDMQRALDFYVGVLDFEVVARWPDADEPPGWVALSAGSARLMLHAGHHRREVDYGRAKGGTVTLSLYVEGLDAFRRELADAGHAASPPETLFYGARESYVLDPDGNELALVEFAAEDPPYLAAVGEPEPRGGRS